MDDIRTGTGIDIHSFADNRKFILGGVEIPYEKGLLGHSDADALLHALCDALLGAAGFEDIGHQFPDTDMKYKDISSLILLEKTMSLVRSRSYKVMNADCTVVLQSPKIYKYIPEMKKNISKILNTENISIKATTSENLGFTGRGEGIYCMASVLIYK
ncbi:MAG TPA: 2-C-methyl-D-erythritol 2,4-cyclodiphosphate synthase [Ignavibacteria bacterium]|nr:2-C-methyl-D-erythritol 2,4-cyclodiphosphate synthase [Ignavibacteria bacterium]